jgi:hypothetical protein
MLHVYRYQLFRVHILRGDITIHKLYSTMYNNIFLKSQLSHQLPKAQCNRSSSSTYLSHLKPPLALNEATHISQLTIATYLTHLLSLL